MHKNLVATLIELGDSDDASVETILENTLFLLKADSLSIVDKAAKSIISATTLLAGERFDRLMSNQRSAAVALINEARIVSQDGR